MNAYQQKWTTSGPNAQFGSSVFRSGVGNVAPTPGTASIYADFPADEAGPVIVSSVPADNATGVATTANIVITFDEDIAFGVSGTITLRSNSGGWADAEVFDVATDQGTGAGQVSIGGAGNTVLTLRPSAALAASTEHALRFTAGAIKDGRGNPMAAIADDTTLSFTTSSGAFTTVAGQSTRFRDLVDWPTTGGKITIAITGTLPTAAACYLAEFDNIYLILDVTSGGSMRLFLKDSAGTTVLPTTAIGTVAWGTEFSVIVAVDLAALTAWTTFNGTTTARTLAANTGNLISGARRLSLLSRAVNTTFAIGTFKSLKVWTDCVSGGGIPPTDTLLRANGWITGPAAVANAHPWKQGGATT